jgi:hypothetical protein
MALWYPDGYPFNFSITGSSLYAIDVADLAVFVEEAPWLWMACWLQEQELMEMMSGGGLMALSAISLESQASPEDDVAEIDSLVKILGQLETIWLTDPNIQQEIDSTDWQGFMGALYDNLLEAYLSTQ